MESQYNFEKWKPSKAPCRTVVTVEPNVLRFNPQVAEKLRLVAGSSVDLYFDKTRQLIGIRIEQRDNPFGPKVRAWERSWSIRSPRFFKDNSIAVRWRRRFHCRWDPKEKMAIIDLRNPVRAGRGKGQ